MKLFNSTKHEVYKNLAESLVMRILEGINHDLEYARHNKNFNIDTSEVYRENIVGRLHQASNFKEDVPLILEYVADNLLKKYHYGAAYKIYERVSPKKAAILDKLMPDGEIMKKSDNELSYSIDKRLDKIMLQYTKNDQIPFIPPLFM